MMFGFRLVFQRSLKSLTFVFLTFLHFVIFSRYYTAVLEMFRAKKKTNSGVFGRGAQSCGVLVWFEFTHFSL